MTTQKLTGVFIPCNEENVELILNHINEKLGYGGWKETIDSGE